VIVDVDVRLAVELGDGVALNAGFGVFEPRDGVAL